MKGGVYRMLTFFFRTLSFVIKIILVLLLAGMFV